MRQKKIKVNVFHYNLLLRCINCCGLGDEDEVKDVLQRIVQVSREEAVGAGDGKEMVKYARCLDLLRDFVQIVFS